MDARELTDLASKSCSLRSTFRGVYPKDGFNTLLQRHEDIQGAFIINQSSRGERGSHWMSAFIDRSPDGRKRCSFFDSLGQGGPSRVGLRLPSDMEVLYNEHRVQPERSASCGVFSLYAIHWNSAGCDFSEIMCVFSPELLNRNEARMMDFLSNLKNGLYLC